MLSKVKRLTRTDFYQTKLAGDCRLNNLGHNRYAVVVSTKLSKKAVIRNKLRRRIYEVVKNIPGSQDIIILGNKRMLNLSYAELGTYINQILSKILFSPRV